MNAKKIDNLKISNGKRWNSFTSINGNISIRYDIDKKVYILTRFDGNPFDGITECVGAVFTGNMKAPENIDEVIEYEVNLLSMAQVEPESKMFNEFDWAYNEDKSEIIVYPVFLKESTNVIICLPEPFLSLTELSVGTVKRVRNGNIDGNMLRLRK